jgi:ubiquitin carboxyl-terminal hydrolase 1
MFNEHTGAQIKNPATVQFPLTFGLGHWTLGSKDDTSEAAEQWSMDPQKSMLPEPDSDEQSHLAASNAQYELRAVVAHFGRHENGHYICYRKHSYIAAADDSGEDEGQTEAWWRLSDDDVSKVGEDFVLRQGGVFMLFYERRDDLPSKREQTAQVELATSLLADVVAEEAAQIPLPTSDDEGIDSDLDGVEEGFLPQVPARSPMTSYEDDTMDGQPVTQAEKEAAHPIQLPTPPESVSESDLDSVTTDDMPVSSSYNGPGPAQAIRMRTANVFADDKGSSESLLLGSRMVSAS